MHKYVLTVLCLVVSTASSAKEATVNEVKIKVTVAGFEPSKIEIPENRPSRLKVTRVTDATCAKELVIPQIKSKTDLPLNREVSINLPGLKAGSYDFGCGMSLMIAGVMIVKAAPTVVKTK